MTIDDERARRTAIVALAVVDVAALAALAVVAIFTDRTVAVAGGAITAVALLIAALGWWRR